MGTIRVGTRGSRLALRQTEIVVEKLKELDRSMKFEIVEIKTTGDKFLDTALSKIGGKGLFIKEIEDALLKKEIDFAVHSLKDMPGEMHEALTLAAYLDRDDASDCIVSRTSDSVASLPEGALIGTSSLRRVCQVRGLRPDLRIEPLRGNINTRLKKLDEGMFDAIVLASAGLIRLGLQERITERLPVESFIPAVCQGIICVETRREDHELIELLKHCDSGISRLAALSERAFLKRLNGNCKIPLGAYCHIDGDRLTLRGMLGKEEDSAYCTDLVEGSINDAEAMGIGLADKLRQKIENIHMG